MVSLSVAEGRGALAAAAVCFIARLRARSVLYALKTDASIFTRRRAPLSVEDLRSHGVRVAGGPPPAPPAGFDRVAALYSTTRANASAQPGRAPATRPHSQRSRRSRV